MIIYHFIVYIIQKAKKEGFEFLWGWDRKPVLAHFQDNSDKFQASCPLQRRENPYLIRLLFFIPKLLLSQCSPLRRHYCLFHPAQHLCLQLPVTSQTAQQHLRTLQIHQTPQEFWHLFQQGLEIIPKFLSPTGFCKRPVPSWACPKRQIFVTSDKHILAPNAVPSSCINNMDKKEILGY